MRFITTQKKDTRRVTIPGYPCVLLQQDSWDDFGYKTTFTVELHLSPSHRVDLGQTKVMRRGQRSGYTEMPEGEFSKLGPAYCSVGTDLDYYKRLYQLGAKVYEDYLVSLRDAAYNDKIKGKFEDEEAFRVSLLRTSGSTHTVEAARVLFITHHDVPPRDNARGFTFRFKTRVAEEADSVSIDFDFRKRKDLPARVNVLIGQNGTGKTRLLSNLAIVASGYGYSSKEDMFARQAGRFVGDPPPFQNVVVVSYSAFDTFAIPGLGNVERARLRNKGDIFGYAYCGLRELVPSSARATAGVPTYRLRTPSEVEDEFIGAVDRIRSRGRAQQLAEALRPLLRDASFVRIGLTPEIADEDEASLRQTFSGMSSGHKIVLKMVVELTLHLTDSGPTLVLIDEPETHLHPPLLAALLRSVRICLSRFDGYAIIATHSPVVLQETPARYVTVVRRQGGVCTVAEPTIETFAENIGLITQDVFNLDDSTTDWHGTLERLAKNRSIEQVEELFGRRLGFAARSYIASLKDDEAEGQ